MYSLNCGCLVLVRFSVGELPELKHILSVCIHRSLCHNLYFQNIAIKESQNEHWACECFAAQSSGEGNRGRVCWYNAVKCSEGALGSGFSVVERQVRHNISTCRVFGNLHFPRATRALIMCYFL